MEIQQSSWIKLWFNYQKKTNILNSQSEFMNKSQFAWPLRAHMHSCLHVCVPVEMPASMWTNDHCVMGVFIVYAIMIPLAPVVAQSSLDSLVGVKHNASQHH